MTAFQAVYNPLERTLVRASHREIDADLGKALVRDTLMNPAFGFRDRMPSKRPYEVLDSKLDSAHSSQRPRVLEGAYKQLIPSKSKNRQTHGEFRQLVDENSEVAAIFAFYVADKLDAKGMSNHAKRLRDHYEAVSRERLGNASTVEQIIAYGTGAVTENIARERYANASMIERGLIETFFPCLDDAEF